jgi:hypothetical protein
MFDMEPSQGSNLKQMREKPLPQGPVATGCQNSHLTAKQSQTLVLDL